MKEIADIFQVITGVFSLDHQIFIDLPMLPRLSEEQKAEQAKKFGAEQNPLNSQTEQTSEQIAPKTLEQTDTPNPINQ
jgi:hypothetical protein